MNYHAAYLKEAIHADQRRAMGHSKCRNASLHRSRPPLVIQFTALVRLHSAPITCIGVLVWSWAVA